MRIKSGECLLPFSSKSGIFPSLSENVSIKLHKDIVSFLVLNIHETLSRAVREKNMD